MMTRRECLALAGQAGAALALAPRLLGAQPQGELIKRPIPATGEELPIIGLGSSATFSAAAREEDYETLRSVLEAMLAKGGTVFDTAPSYGASEEVAGRIVNQIGAQERIFWATKLNVAGRGGESADRAAARRQVETSIERLGREPVDLIQVHNLADMQTQFSILREYKQEGRVRYIGTTTTFKPQYEALEQCMLEEPLDFIGIDYAVDNLSAEERIFPIAQDRGIAVMVYMPFGRTRLWQRVEGVEVPEWAREFGAETWAQFFLKFAASHPAVTVVTPATSRPHHMEDNMQAAYGRLPDEAERRRMIEFIESLPS
ncbi:MAG: aldo/keto reductase [Gammaproteobacteria bacterium]|nr:aldo/keto reductase [Gammaproteobacteria bacterium]